MRNITKRIIIITVVITVISLLCSGCAPAQVEWFFEFFIKWSMYFDEKNKDPNKSNEEINTLVKKYFGEDEDWQPSLIHDDDWPWSVDYRGPDPYSPPVIESDEEDYEENSDEKKTAGYTRGEDAIISTISIIGISPDISASQIIRSASEPPQNQIPVVDMPQDTPDIPDQDGGVTVADAEPPPDSPIKQPDDSSPVGGKPDDEPEDTPDTTEEEPSYGEQEQPHHEHDIYTYYQEDIVEGDNIQSITITVNIASGEVYGNHYFEGYIGDGYRTANYEFDTYLDSSDRFSTTSTATIYEDGQNIGEGTLKITGELASDMSFIAGDIIDETVGYGVMYYAYLISQSEEQPETEDY
jgi:hypothetical protein